MLPSDLIIKIFVINKNSKKSSLKEEYVYPIRDTTRDYTVDEVLNSILEIEKIKNKKFFFSAEISERGHLTGSVVSVEINMDTAEKVCHTIWEDNKRKVPYV